MDLLKQYRFEMPVLLLPLHSLPYLRSESYCFTTKRSWKFKWVYNNLCFPSCQKCVYSIVCPPANTMQLINRSISLHELHPNPCLESILHMRKETYACFQQIFETVPYDLSTSQLVLWPDNLKISRRRPPVTGGLSNNWGLKL